MKVVALVFLALALFGGFIAFGFFKDSASGGSQLPGARSLNSLERSDYSNQSQSEYRSKRSVLGEEKQPQISVGEKAWVSDSIVDPYKNLRENIENFQEHQPVPFKATELDAVQAPATGKTYDFGTVVDPYAGRP